MSSFREDPSSERLLRFLSSESSRDALNARPLDAARRTRRGGPNLVVEC
ncbi:hypothetical protein [Oleiharenicola sp. Vm1]